MAKKTNTEKFFINEEERGMAAKLMTIRNLAMESYLSKNLDESYRKVDEICQMDCGCSANPELKSWEKLIKQGDKYCYDEWQKVRENYITKNA